VRRVVLEDGEAVGHDQVRDALDGLPRQTELAGDVGDRRWTVLDSREHLPARARLADRAGELVWPMPLPDELRASLDSQVADIANIGERHGGMMTAAVFLREFVGKGKDGEQIPWAHIDIAGPSFNNGSPYGYTHKQGTGCTVRTLVAYVEDILAAA